MPEYVKLADAVRTVLEKPDMTPDEKNGVVRRLKALPAADVAPVMHGRWHRFLKGSGSYNGGIILSDAFQCTVCKESFWNKSNYCPNCGAIMDGGQES